MVDCFLGSGKDWILTRCGRPTWSISAKQRVERPLIHITRVHAGKTEATLWSGFSLFAIGGGTERHFAWCCCVSSSSDCLTLKAGRTFSFEVGLEFCLDEWQQQQQGKQTELLWYPIYLTRNNNNAFARLTNTDGVALVYLKIIKNGPSAGYQITAGQWGKWAGNHGNGWWMFFFLSLFCWGFLDRSTQK